MRWPIWLAAAASMLLVGACAPRPPASSDRSPTPATTLYALPGEATPTQAAEAASTGTFYDPSHDPYTGLRDQLVTSGIEGWGISDPAVIAAMRKVPRHLFVPENYLDQAYANHPVPIGYGQTISQPYIVALMTESLELDSDDVVLEIGTGSGYQAAVLAEIVKQVYTIEIVGALAEQATARLAALGYDNIEVRHADGYFGWEEHAPFDAIIVTAAPDHVPPPLQAQLADGGRLVIPVGPVGGYQELWLVERHGDQFTTTSLGSVAFVPLTRDVRDQ